MNTFELKNKIAEAIKVKLISMGFEESNAQDQCWVLLEGEFKSEVFDLSKSKLFDTQLIEFIAYQNFAICSFEEFKELYPFQIYNNYFAKTKSSAKIRLNKHNT